MIISEGKTLGLLDERQAGQYLGVSRATLQAFRQRGLQFVKLGDRSIRYRVEDLDSFVASHLVVPAVSEAAPVPAAEPVGGVPDGKP